VGALAFHLLISVSAAQSAESIGDPIRGQSLFAAKECVRCHAVRGAGGRIGPDLGRQAVKGSFFEIAAGLWNHSLNMDQKMQEFRVPRPTFRDDELADLVAFLYFLNYFDEPGDSQTGRMLFTQKHCIECHRVEGIGGRVGPDLSSQARGLSPLRIAQDLWNHGPQMVGSMKAKGLDVPKFEGNQIIDLIAYLRSRGERRGAREFQSAGDPEIGRKLFGSKGCARCHAIFGNGEEIGPDLGSGELRGSVTQLSGRMWNHWPDMAEAMETLEMRLPTFKGDELADIFAYIFISRYAGQPGSPQRGRTVYRQKGCSACHGLAGEGSISAPALRNLVAAETREQILQRMWNHAPRMRVQMGNRQIGWPYLEAAEVADLLAFLARGLSDGAAAAQAVTPSR
jgi:mono/diheme cytochrome c family protein